jgi:predicted permease
MPDWPSEIRRRLDRVGLRPEREAEIVDEVAQHLEDRFQSLLASGRSAIEAENGVWSELEDGDVIGQRVAEIESAAPTTLAGLEAGGRAGLAAGFWQDLRYAVRGLRKRPLLSATVIVTIALSLGPTTAVLGMADALFFKPLPGIAGQDRLLNVTFGTVSGRGISPWVISYANAADMTRGATTIAAIAGTQEGLSAGLAVEGASPRLASVAYITANYFDVLGVRPIAGRGLRADEDRNPGGEPVGLLGENDAREFFGSPDAAIGKTVLVNSLPFTVIGVVPYTFAGTRIGSRLDLWMPGMAYKRAEHWPPKQWSYEANRGPFSRFIVRMADGATVEQTMSELSARARALADRYPAQNTVFQTVGPILQPGFAAPASLRPTAVRAMQFIGGVAALLVLLGMANVANLLIFRGLAVGRDVAIRKALGAGTRRLIQLRLVESLLLALMGAAAGVGVALALGALFTDFAVPSIGPIDVVVDWHVLTVTIALALLVGVGFGLAPAVLAVRESLTGALGRGMRTDLPRASRLRHALAAVQIALSFTLLVGALLFLATLRNLHAVDLGFDPTGVTLVNLSLRGHGYTNARALDYERRLADSLRREPGVQSVAVAFSPPMFGLAFVGRVYLPDADPKKAGETAINAVSPDYFRTLGLPIVRGRAFTSEEAFAGARPAETPVILSETLARALFGTIEATGRELREPEYQSPPTTLRVIGVTREAHFGGVDSPPDSVLYEPLARLPNALGAFVLVRSDLGVERAGRLIARMATAIDPAVPVAPERSVATVIDRRLGQQRLFAWLLGLLGAVGFLLAAVGLHGLIAQTVTERRREFGIRLAIGADRSQLMRPVLRQAAALGGAGLISGLTLTWFSGRIVESHLFGVTSRDPWICAAAALVMILVVAFASAAPARAATRINPIDVLRAE